MSTNDWLAIFVMATSLYAASPAAIAFCALYASHILLEPMMSDAIYYVSLILIDSAVAFAITSIKSPSRASVITGAFAGLFLVINCAGFLSWYLYLPPTPYDASCSAVYVAMAALLIREGRNGGGWNRFWGVARAFTGSFMRKGVGVHKEDGGKV